jgi:hypothetical protein
VTYYRKPRPGETILPPPPAYLSYVPDKVLAPRDNVKFAGNLRASLDARGIAARPTLLDIEAERTRRGMRPTLALRRPGRRRRRGIAA